MKTIHPGKIKMRLLFVLLGLIALGSIHTSAEPLAAFSRVIASINTPKSDVKVNLASSQGKFVEGKEAELFVKVSIDTPKMAKPSGKIKDPVDLILVLDRSGSMNDAHKMPYAKKAMATFVDHLSEGDRIGIVSFDSAAKVELPLTFFNKKTIGKIKEKIKGIQIGGSTNMYDGILLGSKSTDKKQRTKRMVVLSDGITNTGITEESAFTKLVKDLSRNSLSVSTVGMGLDFNEKLLGSVADHGMGNYTFVESMQNLAETLKKDLKDAKEQYASSSTLTITLADGVHLAHAADYPLTKVSQNSYTINTGPLLEDSLKSFILKLAIDKTKKRSHKVLEIALNHKKKGDSKELQARVNTPIVSYVGVGREKATEAWASINKEVFKESWQDQKGGELKLKVSKLIKDDKSKQAVTTIKNFRAEVALIEKRTGIKILDNKLVNDLEEMEYESQDADVGTMREKSVKRKRYSKKHYSASRKSLRKSSKK